MAKCGEVYIFDYFATTFMYLAEYTITLSGNEHL